MGFYKFYKKYGIYCVLLIVLVFFSLASKSFLSARNLINILRQISMIGIVCVGVAIVIISGGSDLSVGGQMAIGGILGAHLMVNLGCPIIVAVLAVLLLTTCLGMINGLICNTFAMNPLIVTLGNMLVLNGLAIVVTNGSPIFGLPEKYKWLGQGYIGFIPTPVIIYIIIIALGIILLNKTYLGRYFYAMGGNPAAARTAGINVEKFRLVSYMICGFLTGIASLIMLSRVNSAQPTAGSSYPFDCMTAVCLGGIAISGGEGSMQGAVIGVIIIGVLDNGLQLIGCDANLISSVKGLVLLAAVAIDSYQKKAKITKAKSR